ncbi:hypothetical protein FRC17_009725 [Serendipita sp. 399]|nr:hypothetical protein FRC17_009725 [Serendipita sp. 399]
MDCEYPTPTLSKMRREPEALIPSDENSKIILLRRRSAYLPVSSAVSRPGPYTISQPRPHPSTFVIPPPPPPLPEPTISPLLLSHPATGLPSSSSSSSSSSSPTDSRNEEMKVTPFNLFSALPIPTFGNTIDGYFMPYDASSLSRKRRRPYQTSLSPLSLHDDNMHHYPPQQQQQQRVLRSNSHQVVVSQASTSTPYQQAKVTSSLRLSPPHCGLDPLPSPISLPTSIPILSSPTTTTTTTRSRENEGDAAWTPKRSNSTTTSSSSSSSSSISSMSMIKAKVHAVNKTPPEDLPPALLPHFDALVDLFSRKRVNTQEYQRVLAPFSVPVQRDELEIAEKKKGGRGGRKSRVAVVASSSSSLTKDEDEYVDEEDTEDEEYVESNWRSSTRGSLRSRKKKPRPMVVTTNGVGGSARRCLLCNHTLFHQGQMNQHIMDHFDIYPFRCYVDGCPGELKHERNLRRHIRSKHPYGRVSRARKMGLSTSSRRQPGAGTDDDDEKDSHDSSSIGKEVADEVVIVRDTESVLTTMQSANGEDE